MSVLEADGTTGANAGNEAERVQELEQRRQHTGPAAPLVAFPTL